MSFLNSSEQTVIGQTRFDGGMNMLAPGENQYRDGMNLVIRDGYPTTRPGIRRYLAVDGGWLAGFWFNQENMKYNDATHTGFWYLFNFVRTVWGATIQGCEIVRLSIHDENKILFAIGGAVYTYERGYLAGITCDSGFASTETVEFVQANDKIYMFRSGGNVPLCWDAAAEAAGFVAVADPGTGDAIPHADNGLWHQGRMWLSVDDDIYASGALEPTIYDFVGRKWDIERGQDEAGVILYPYHEDIILAFKKGRISAVQGISAPVLSGTTMADNVTRRTVDTKSGAIARHAIVTIGEDVWYLGYGGIYGFSRNQQNRLELDPIAVSAAIQPYIDRINWGAASCACAAVHNNYVLFAVPVDGSTTNNMVLVYDRLANGGAGAWCGPWSSATLNPVRFFKDDEKLLFLSVDGIVRQMFTNDPWDSEDPYADTPQYSATTLYQGGELVGYEYNGDRIYRALITTIGVAPTDATAWEEVVSQWRVYDIESWIETRYYNLAEMSPAILFGRAEILFRAQDPEITLEQLSRDIGTEKTIFDAQEYDRTLYEVANVGPWDPTNANLDFADPYRQDYTLIVNSSGITADADGLRGGVWKTHVLRWLPLMVSDRFIGARITNVRGKLKILGISFAAAARPMAGKQVA